MLLTRPLIFIDAETDGPGDPDPVTDRIVQLGLCRLEVDGTATHRTRLIHPGAENLPLKRTDVHRITDEMLADAPSFAKIARSLMKMLEGCDIGTYNGGRYDIPLLWAEFYRAGITWDTTAFLHVDVSRLWSKMEPRSLGDAQRRFMGVEPDENLHDAGVDSDVTRQVLDGMLEAWPSAPRSVEELAAITRSTAKIGGKELPYIDLAGTLVRDEDGDAVFTHRRVRGKKVREELGYARWMLDKADFGENTNAALRAEL